MKHFVETRISLVMLIACVIGLILPGLPALPDISIAVALAMLMFCSCYKLRDGGFSDLCWREILTFYIGRYLLLPPLLWLAAQQWLPDYATAILLISVLPIGWPALPLPIYSAARSPPLSRWWC